MEAKIHISSEVQAELVACSHDRSSFRDAIAANFADGRKKVFSVDDICSGLIAGVSQQTSYPIVDKGTGWPVSDAAWYLANMPPSFSQELLQAVRSGYVYRADVERAYQNAIAQGL